VNDLLLRRLVDDQALHQIPERLPPLSARLVQHLGQEQSDRPVLVFQQGHHIVVLGCLAGGGVCGHLGTCFVSA
jgi:hypothetical protein